MKGLRCILNNSKYNIMNNGLNKLVIPPNTSINAARYSFIINGIRSTSIISSISGISFVSF